MPQYTLPLSLLALLMSITSPTTAHHLKEVECQTHFEAITLISSPFLFTSNIKNFDYNHWASILPSNPFLNNTPIPPTNNPTILTLGALFPDLTPEQVKYPLVINYDDVVDQCGPSGGTYEWNQVSDTLTTWILPIIGLIVQLPYESNRRWQAVLMVVRWLGGPWASLTYILWNVSILGRCARFVDVGSPEEVVDSGLGGGEGVEGAKTFEKLRNSFGILAAMNQYSLVEGVGLDEEEVRRGILVALFSEEGDVEGVEGVEKFRREVGEQVRRLRRRGIVPVLVSLLW